MHGCNRSVFERRRSGKVLGRGPKSKHGVAELLLRAKFLLGHPSAVDPQWVELFERFDRGDMTTRPRAPAFLTPSGSLPDNLPRSSVSAGIQIYDLVHTFRQFGHLIAHLDPLGGSPTELVSLQPTPDALVIERCEVIR